jgi:hypothetical protein
MELSTRCSDPINRKNQHTGQEGFTISKQAAIYSFATDPAQIKLDHSTTNVFE